MVASNDVCKDKAGIHLDGEDRILSGDLNGFRTIAKWFGKKGSVRPDMPGRLSTARPAGRVFNSNPTEPARPGAIAG